MIQTALLISLLLSGTSGTLVYDSGEPVSRLNGDVAFMSVWRVLDPLDNLCVRTVVPFELDKPTRVTALAFYSFNPKDPADKLVDIYAGTDENTVGTLYRALTFEQHEGVTQGWTLMMLDQQLTLPAGKYGISFHGRYEFHSYWAGNAPKGAGYAWARPNDDIQWIKAGEDDFGFVPNFTVRIYGLQPKNVRAWTGQRPAQEPQTVPLNPVDTDVPGTPNNYEYEPGTATWTYHVIWRPVLKQKAVEATPK